MIAPSKTKTNAVDGFNVLLNAVTKKSNSRLKTKNIASDVNKFSLFFNNFPVGLAVFLEEILILKPSLCDLTTKSLKSISVISVLI